MKIEIDMKGRDEMQRAIRLLGPKGVKAAGSALWKEGERIMTKAKELTPVDLNVLKPSGHVQLPEVNGETVSVTMGFGGAASEYAVYVHENLEARHKPPTQAKFLEKPFMDASQDMGLRIAQELWAQLK